MKNTTMILLGVISTAIAAAGCGSYHHYEGPPRDRSEIAIVQGSRIAAVDGREVPHWYSAHELLPGPHAIEVKNLMNRAEPFELILKAEAGHTYLVRTGSWCSQTKLHVFAWIIEEESGGVVAGRRPPE
jgi:hypothetical protein